MDKIFSIIWQNCYHHSTGQNLLVIHWVKFYQFSSHICCTLWLGSPILSVVRHVYSVNTPHTHPDHKPGNGELTGEDQMPSCTRSTPWSHHLVSNMLALLNSLSSLNDTKIYSSKLLNLLVKQNILQSSPFVFPSQ